MGDLLQANWAAKTAMGLVALFGASAFATSDAEACINRLVKVPGADGVNIKENYYSPNYKARIPWGVNKPLDLSKISEAKNFRGIWKYHGDIVPSIKGMSEICTDIGKQMLAKSDALYLETFLNECKPGESNPERDRIAIRKYCNQKVRIDNPHPAKPSKKVAGLHSKLGG